MPEYDPASAGRAAYLAYREAAAGRSIHNEPLPDWDATPPAIRDYWTYAAQAVIDWYLRG